MNSFNMKIIVSGLIIANFIISYAQSDEGNTLMNKALTVCCIVEAKAGKEDVLKQELMNVMQPSRNESACIEYHLHQDINNPCRFILYEKWQSKEAHEQQFQKPYIIALASKLGDLLAKPFEAFFLEEL